MTQWSADLASADRVGLNTLFVYVFAPCAGVVANAQKWLYFNGGEAGCKDGQTSGCDNIRQLIHDNLFCGDVITQDDGEEFCRDGMFAGVHEKWASLTWTVVRIALWVGVAGWLHWRRWYWTV